MGKLINEVKKAFAGLPKLEVASKKVNRLLSSRRWKEMKKEVIEVQKRIETRLNNLKRNKGVF